MRLPLGREYSVWPPTRRIFGAIVGAIVEPSIVTKSVGLVETPELSAVDSLEWKRQPSLLSMTNTQPLFESQPSVPGRKGRLWPTRGIDGRICDFHAGSRGRRARPRRRT